MLYECPKWLFSAQWSVVATLSNEKIYRGKNSQDRRLVDVHVRCLTPIKVFM